MRLPNKEATGRMIWRGVRRAGMAALLLAAASDARAETSSWSQRTIIAPDKSAPAQGNGWNAVPAPVKPKAVRTSPATTPNKNITEVRKSPTSDDGEEAYFAFDQGRYLTALDLAQKAAAKGDPQAHTLIARIYEEGVAVPKDEKVAAQWYEKAAKLGDTEAVFSLGVLAAQGRGIAKDERAAAAYFEAAAAKGHAVANYNLALLFLQGRGKPENPHRAFMHMRYAAENGIAAAQYDLGTLYATGTGVDPNAFEAVKWIEKAANAGHIDATVELAVLLFKGHGLPPDQKRGAQLFRNAAEKGVAVAQNRLARCYVFGAGVEKNVREAGKWYLLAKAGGVTDEKLEALVAKFSKTDRLAAEKAAEEWREKSLVQ